MHEISKYEIKAAISIEADRCSGETNAKREDEENNYSLVKQAGCCASKFMQVSKISPAACTYAEK